MDTFNWLTALTVFCVYVVFDVLYALYVLCVARQQAIRASAISSVMYSLGAFGIMTYLHNPLYLIAVGGGAFVGTYIAVKYMGNWHG
jgi:hypothetical protein